MSAGSQRPIPASTIRSRKRRALMTANERTRERTKYAVRRRVDLVDEIAPDHRCAECGEQFPAEQLTIDHVDGRDWCIDEYSPSMRAARYWREFEAGVALRALCNPCNGTAGGSMRYGYDRSGR